MLTKKYSITELHPQPSFQILTRKTIAQEATYQALKGGDQSKEVGRNLISFVLSDILEAT